MRKGVPYRAIGVLPSLADRLLNRAKFTEGSPNMTEGIPSQVLPTAGLDQWQAGERGRSVKGAELDGANLARDSLYGGKPRRGATTGGGEVAALDQRRALIDRGATSGARHGCRTPLTSKSLSPGIPGHNRARQPWPGRRRWAGRGFGRDPLPPTLRDRAIAHAYAVRNHFAVAMCRIGAAEAVIVRQQQFHFWLLRCGVDGLAVLLPVLFQVLPTFLPSKR
jgi:hypothetical protein